MSKKREIDMLRTVAEYRILTVPQITALCFTTKQAARRRIRQLTEMGLVESVQRGFGRTRGRPESIISLTRQGAKHLYDEGILPSTMSYDHVTGEKIRSVDHQLLVNWFRIHLLQIEKDCEDLSVAFLSPTSPFQIRDNDQPVVSDRVPVKPSDEETIRFTPDGVFRITHEKLKKSLLFLLEVDMSTETIASPKGDPRDIRNKIIKYRNYFGLRLYKRYEQIFNAEFNGFRLLFLANTRERMAVLCRIVQEMPTSDFVRVSEQEKMFSHGLGDTIWTRGGNLNAPLESILGTLCCSTLVPATS